MENRVLLAGGKHGVSRLLSFHGGHHPRVIDLSQIPAWCVLVDALALQALRTHLRVEFDLRAVLRSKSPPEDVLERAERILERGVELAKEHVLIARAVFILNCFDLPEERARMLAEQIGGMQLLLLARVSGWACVEYFRRRDDLDLAQSIGGLIPLCVNLEDDLGHLFERRVEPDIPAA